jgi:hypothetical protein
MSDAWAALKKGAKKCKYGIVALQLATKPALATMH